VSTREELNHVYRGSHDGGVLQLQPGKSGEREAGDREFCARNADAGETVCAAACKVLVEWEALGAEHVVGDRAEVRHGATQDGAGLVDLRSVVEEEVDFAGMREEGQEDAVRLLRVALAIVSARVRVAVLVIGEGEGNGAGTAEGQVDPVEVGVEVDERSEERVCGRHLTEVRAHEHDALPGAPEAKPVPDAIHHPLVLAESPRERSRVFAHREMVVENQL
jgi:hypothetical protein